MCEELSKNDVDVSQLGFKAALVRKAMRCNTLVYVDHPKDEVLHNMNRYNNSLYGCIKL